MLAMTAVVEERNCMETGYSNFSTHQIKPRKHSNSCSSATSVVPQTNWIASCHQQQQAQSVFEHSAAREPSFGMCFDVDGVLARGTIGIPEAAEAFKKLVNEKHELKYPVSFVTNSLNKATDRANQLTGMLGVQVTPEQMIQAPGPLSVFSHLHHKFCLIVGQGKILEIAKELGFNNMCTIEELAGAYPLLDVVDHDNRRRISVDGYTELDFKRVEAIILMGEPKRWESALQIIVDLLRTDGKPDRPYETIPRKHIPVVACNMDLQFKDRAATPRFGHGAFLVCLEALYKKLTGFDLDYSALVGKPSEITFRYAEHVLNMERAKLGYTETVKTMYLIGDTPEVDIAGSNLYQKYIDRLKARRQENTSVSDEARLELHDPHLPDSRNVPSNASFTPQTVDNIVPILVCTGVYKEGAILGAGDLKHINHGHRDFPDSPELDVPAKICRDVNEAIDYILERERIAAFDNNNNKGNHGKS